VPGTLEQHNPRVSVVMPAHNAALFIGTAVESVLAQALTDWELIVVDDGSTDSTQDIIQRYRDRRIVYVRQENQGAAAARNVALDMARGQYVAFLDADDCYLPNALQDLVAYLDSHHKADVALSDGFFCDGEGRPLMRLSEHRPGRYEDRILEPLVLSSTVICAINCTLSRRSSIVEHEIHFDPSLDIGEDWDFWIQLARFARFGYLDELTCLYRVHGANTTRVFDSAKRRQELVRGRLKILYAPWFGGLSLPTRREFFYGLLIGLLSSDPGQQREILASAPFLALPGSAQATLLRHVATDCLLQQGDKRFAMDCLHAAVNLRTEDRKSLILFECLRLGGSLCRGLLGGWQLVHRAIRKVRGLGKPKPKPVPSALAPLPVVPERVPDN
jgi:glycosyltransferase involved in cell wall biosynthesis